MYMFSFDRNKSVVLLRRLPRLSLATAAAAAAIRSRWHSGLRTRNTAES